MLVSAVWTLILTAPIHYRASTAELVMWCYISPNLFSIMHYWKIWTVFKLNSMWPLSVFNKENRSMNILLNISFCALQKNLRFKVIQAPDQCFSHKQAPEMTVSCYVRYGTQKNPRAVLSDFVQQDAESAGGQDQCTMSKKTGDAGAQAAEQPRCSRRMNSGAVNLEVCQCGQTTQWDPRKCVAHLNKEPSFALQPINKTLQRASGEMHMIWRYVQCKCIHVVPRSYQTGAHTENGHYMILTND